MPEDEDGHRDGVCGVAVDSRSERRQVIRRLLEHSFEPSEIAEADSRGAAIELVGRCRPAELRAALVVAPAERAVRHRPPNERPVSPVPLRDPEPAVETATAP